MDMDVRGDLPPSDLVLVPDHLVPIDPGLQRTWIKRSPVVKPDRTHAPKLVYHVQKGLTYLYGGDKGAVVFLSQMRTYDKASWSLVCDPCPPGPRWGHALVYDDVRDRIVLFGGYDGTKFKNDLWELSQGTWQLRSTGPGPGPRAAAMAAFDSKRGRMVVFGGVDSSGGKPLDEVWEYDGASWSGPHLPQVRPSARLDDGTAAVFVDSQAQAPALRERVVIFGGVRDLSDLSPSNVFDDMWAWDGSKWTIFCQPCTGRARFSAAVGYDPRSGRLIIAGGWDGTVEIAGTMELAANTFQATSADPPARDSSGLVFDRVRNAFVLFGGNGSCSGSGDCDETWEFVAP